jgi:hypothetical protein
MGYPKHMNSKTIGSLILSCLFCGLFTYGLFYNAYKFHTLEHGGWDEYHYLKMAADPFNMDVAPAPNVFRQFGTTIAYLISKAGIYHETNINFRHPEIDQRVFFAMLASNYLALLLTMVTIGRSLSIRVTHASFTLTALGGMLFIASWGPVNFGLTASAEAWTCFFIAVCFHACLTRNRLLFGAMILLSITQKEIVSIAFTVFLCCMAWQAEGVLRRRYLQMLLMSAGAFLIYYFVTNHLVEVSVFRDQLVPEKMPERWRAFTFSKDMLLQTILLNSIFWTYLATLGLARARGIAVPADRKETIALLATLGAIYVIGMLTGIGANTGRITLVLSPVWAVLTAEMIFRLPLKESRHAGEGG